MEGGLAYRIVFLRFVVTYNFTNLTANFYDIIILTRLAALL